MIRYHNITKCDMVNGSGIRVVLWCSHCEHNCIDCHNPETWSECSGIPFDEIAKQELFEELEKDYISGITFSGGDSLSLINRYFITQLMKEIKDKFPNKNIWAYTGYEWNEINELEAMKYIDFLVDGKYIRELSIPSPKYRGSSNQFIIDVQKSLKQNTIVLSEYN